MSGLGWFDALSRLDKKQHKNTKNSPKTSPRRVKKYFVHYLVRFVGRSREGASLRACLAPDDISVIMPTAVCAAALTLV